MFHFDGQCLNLSVQLGNAPLKTFDRCRLGFDDLIVKPHEDAGEHESKKPDLLHQRNGSKNFNIEVWQLHSNLTLQTEAELKLVHIDLTLSSRFAFY